MILALSILFLAGCETVPPPPPTPAETAVVVAKQAATSRGYVIHICADPVGNAERVGVTWKGHNVVEGRNRWSDPQPLALTMPIDSMLCGNPSAVFHPGIATTIMVQLDDMSSANGIWIRYPSPDYKEDDPAPNQFLPMANTDDTGWFTFAVYPVQRGVPLIPIGTVRPGQALAPPVELPKPEPAPPPFHPIGEPITPPAAATPTDGVAAPT